MSTRNAAIRLVANKIHDIGGGVDQNEDVMLSDTEIGEEVDAAVVQFSVDKPREKVIDITAITTPYIDTSTLTSFVPGWSTILSIEWQAAAVSATYLPTYVNLDTGIEEYRDATKHYIYLKGLTPAASDVTRFRYTAPHATLTATSSDDTIPAVYFDAVCNLAASYCCTRLAAHFAAASDPTIAADAVSYRDSQLRMRQCAEDFMQNYQRQVGVTEPGSRPASTVRDWNTRTSVGTDWLTHQAGWRSWRRVS